MGLLDRVSTLVRANLNDLIDRAEDPEKVIKQLIIDMNNQLIQVKTQVAAAIADEKRLYQRQQEAQQQADEWQSKAELAVEKGDDDLAKQALARRNSYTQTAQGLQEQWQAQSAQVQTLKDALRQLETKVSEAEAKKDLLIARSRRARAEETVQKTLSGVRGVGAMSDFERLEEKVEQQEARAAAYTDLSTDTLDQKFATLEQESEVDRQLRELKAKKGQGQLPPGGSSS
ncbi:MAG TPA: PspA/IM30 family protein [Chloroflexota bacterium]|nr:PspA/IM30 family protein [Chloroflexota bacterium]